MPLHSDVALHYHTFITTSEGKKISRAILTPPCSVCAIHTEQLGGIKAKLPSSGSVYGAFGFLVLQPLLRPDLTLRQQVHININSARLQEGS